MKIEVTDNFKPRFYFSQVSVGSFFIWDNEVYLKAKRRNSDAAYAIRVGASPYVEFLDDDFCSFDGEICDISDNTQIDMIIENAKIVW